MALTINVNFHLIDELTFSYLIRYITIYISIQSSLFETCIIMTVNHKKESSKGRWIFRLIKRNERSCHRHQDCCSCYISVFYSFDIFSSIFSHETRSNNVRQIKSIWEEYSDTNNDLLNFSII